MKTTHARTAAPTSVSTKRTAKLERLGRYEEALGLFGEAWEQEDFLPATEHLSEAEAAETLLRFGALIGFHGPRGRRAGAQERAKNILTDVRERFVILGDPEKIAESENHIALAYWRRGEHQEGHTWVDEALSHALPDTSDARHYSLVIKSLLLLDEKKDAANIEWCLTYEDTFRECVHPFLAGSLFANLGVSYRNLSRSAEAMRYFCQARSCHEVSGNKTYLAIVQNNLAMLYNAERRFESAHEAADAAIRIYKQVKDKTREASSLDTKAQISLAEGRLTEAARTIDRSIAMLRKSESSAYLAESLYTKARIALAGKELDLALISIGEAVAITRVQQGEAAGSALAAEFLDEVRKQFEPATEAATLASGEMDLVLPAEIAQYASYRGLWINSPHFEAAGLDQGTLAVLANAEPERGDLVAVVEKNTGAVSCGSYDAEFGIICLDRGDDQPLLFDANDVEVLGKVVGVSTGVADRDGKTRVRVFYGCRKSSISIPNRSFT